MSEQKIDMAIEIFKLNIRLFPNEANPYDSLGEAYMIKGDIESSIKSYKNALEIDPNFQIAKEQLKKLTKHP